LIKSINFKGIRVITLKEALALSKDELKDFREKLAKDIKNNSDLGAYIEQFTNEDINSYADGIPIAIKDNIQVDGWSVTASSKILQGYVAPYNATVIDKLVDAGLAPFGRTNMDEFAMGSSTETSYYGITKNPHNPNLVPGGSSGGSAAAVGAGLAIAALGSDTGGSIRQPAAFCGCVGMKPTYGKVSRYGLNAYSSSLDQIGPITQNVEDAALLYDIIAGYEAKDSTSIKEEHKKVSDKLDPTQKLTIAVVKSHIDEADEDVKKTMYQTIELLEKNGHKIIYKEMIDPKYEIAAYYITASAEASANLSRYDGIRFGYRANEPKNLSDSYIRSRSEGFGEEVKRRILIGTFVLSSGYYDAYYIQAQKTRHLIRDEFNEVFKDADVIFSPVAPTTAFEIGGISDPLEMYLSDIYTIGVNLAGLPAISLPIGKCSNNMPIGAQFIAPALGEQTMFNAALGLETILKEA
jgi:aspartyl-tRNA(Asn)/glutamyl-tRNA(Gln) amidotransferase subunit A